LATLSQFPSLLPLGLAAKKLARSDESAITTFCQQCGAFFSLVAGEARAADTALQLLEARPRSVDVTRKHVIGFERGGALIAIVDLLEDYPDEANWYVGLLLLSPDERGRGLGTAIWTAIETWIRGEGGSHARLIVQEQNPDAARFWRTVGFTTNGTTEQYSPTRTNRCWCFEKPLIESPA
jgi:ribosomal protein S18 acetylase RimI-like enzyme